MGLNGLVVLMFGAIQITTSLLHVPLYSFKAALNCLSIYLYSSNNKQAICNTTKHAVGQDSETEILNHCPKQQESCAIAKMTARCAL